MNLFTCKNAPISIVTYNHTKDHMDKKKKKAGIHHQCWIFSASSPYPQILHMHTVSYWSVFALLEKYKTHPLTEDTQFCVLVHWITMKMCAGAFRLGWFRTAVFMPYGRTVFFQFWEGSLFSLWWKSARVKTPFGTEGVKGCIVFPAAGQICGSATSVCSPSGDKHFGSLTFGFSGCHSTIAAFPAMVEIHEV